MASGSRKPRVLVGVTNTIAAFQFPLLAEDLCEWAEVRVVFTRCGMIRVDRSDIPSQVVVYTNEDEWNSWRMLGDSVLHMELRNWADAMLIAPLSAHSLAKIVSGLCDNLLTLIVRAWDASKPLAVAPSMDQFMWRNSVTKPQLDVLRARGMVLWVSDEEDGAMVEAETLDTLLKDYFL